MRLFMILSMSCLLAGGAMAQRGGGGHGGGGFGGGGGFHGGGFGGGGGFRGGSGFTGGGFRGGFNGGGFRGGFGGFGGFNRGVGRFGYGGYGGWGWGGWGVGWGWPGYYWGDWGYPYYPDYSYAPYGTYYDPGAYAYSPNTTVVYPPQQPAAVYVQPPVHSSMHVYDEYGQEVGNGGGNSMAGSAAPRETSSPLYLIALQDHVIHAAISYRVEGGDLIYVTQQHEEKRVPLAQVDRSLTMQLNRERRVQINLP